MQDIEHRRSQARTSQDFTELAESCIARARDYEAKRMRLTMGILGSQFTETPSGALDPNVQNTKEMIAYCDELAEHFKELAQCYVQRARELETADG